MFVAKQLQVFNECKAESVMCQRGWLEESHGEGTFAKVLYVVIHLGLVHPLLPAMIRIGPSCQLCRPEAHVPQGPSSAAWGHGQFF